MSKLLNFVTLSALLALTFVSGPAPVSAVAVEGVSHGSNLIRSHHAVAAKRRRTPARRCKPRTPPPAAKPAPGKSDGGDSDGKSDGGKSGGSGDDDGGYVKGNNPSRGDYSLLGYAWTLPDNKLPIYKQSKTTLIYNWRESGPSGNGFEFMPMLWGEKNKAAFAAATSKHTPKFALMCNEPELNNDSGLSSGLSPQSAVDMYWSHMDPLRKKGTGILTPAVTSGPKGREWMQKFMSICKGCEFIGQAVHWYDISAANAQEHFTWHHNQFKLPIYITEMAFNNFNGNNQLSVDQARTQMANFNNWAKGQDWIMTVMYFGFIDDMVNVSENLKLIDGNQKPNSLGKSVINALAS